MNLKELLKNKKLVGGVAAAVLVAAAAVTTVLLWPHNTPPLETTPVSVTPGESCLASGGVCAGGRQPAGAGGWNAGCNRAVDVTVSLDQQPTAPTGTPVEKPEKDNSGKAVILPNRSRRWSRKSPAMRAAFKSAAEIRRHPPIPAARRITTARMRRRMRTC